MDARVLIAAGRVAPPVGREHVTGLVLAGGRGSRMGGIDKGLQPHLGQPLALHALLRLAPQVGPLMVSANRNLPAYAALGAALGASVWPDPPDLLPEYAGPLAGILAGLQHCGTPWLATVPCDSPGLPPDLVDRLASAATAAGADIAIAATRRGHADAPQGAPAWQLQPVFCLLATALQHSLLAFVQAGGRGVAQFAALPTHRQVRVPFDDAEAFSNANTPADLLRLQLQTPLHPGGPPAC